MKLMHTLRDNCLTFNRIVTEDTNCIRWYDRPLREAVFHARPVDLIKVPKGTVMPKYWTR